MPSTTPLDTKIGERYIRMLKYMNSRGCRFMDVKGDDSDGRVTGEYSCRFCGMRSHDPDHPKTCCEPDFQRAEWEAEN